MGGTAIKVGDQGKSYCKPSFEKLKFYHKTAAISQFGEIWPFLNCKKLVLKTNLEVYGGFRCKGQPN